ncbi:MAG: hypothetical protein MZV63_34260 [Marinilabiliales bacterium]|nr:hypothetical protein [Marinilabiliales bacterium]
MARLAKGSNIRRFPPDLVSDSREMDRAHGRRRLPARAPPVHAGLLDSGRRRPRAAPIGSHGRPSPATRSWSARSR